MLDIGTTITSMTKTVQCMEHIPSKRYQYQQLDSQKTDKSFGFMKTKKLNR